MKFNKAFQALILGEKIALKDYPEDYIYYNSQDNKIYDNRGERVYSLYDKQFLSEWVIIANDYKLDDDSDEVNLPNTLFVWHDGYDTGYKVGKNDALLKVRDYINEMR